MTAAGGPPESTITSLFAKQAKFHPSPPPTIFNALSKSFITLIISLAIFPAFFCYRLSRQEATYLAANSDRFSGSDSSGAARASQRLSIGSRAGGRTDATDALRAGIGTAPIA